MKKTNLLTKRDVQALRKKKTGTNGKFVSATEQEVKNMQKHLGTLYTGKIQLSFAEKIVLRNKAYGEELL